MTDPFALIPADSGGAVANGIDCCAAGHQGEVRAQGAAGRVELLRVAPLLEENVLDHVGGQIVPEDPASGDPQCSFVRGEVPMSGLAEAPIQQRAGVSHAGLITRLTEDRDDECAPIPGR